jgi:hypothetical protein
MTLSDPLAHRLASEPYKTDVAPGKDLLFVLLLFLDLGQ